MIRDAGGVRLLQFSRLPAALAAGWSNPLRSPKLLQTTDHIYWLFGRVDNAGYSVRHQVFV